MNIESIKGIAIPSGDRTMVPNTTIKLYVIGIDGYYPCIPDNEFIVPYPYITFTSSNTALCTVNSSGVITSLPGVSGTAIIYASVFGVTSQINIVVTSGVGGGMPIGFLGLTYAN